MSEKIYVFKRFERFWHWSQAALIITLMLTGFEVHGSYVLFGFGQAVDIHTVAAWSLVTLWVFAIFWHFTTGEWKQYIPTLDKVDAMIKYYLMGIFTHAPHPFKQTVGAVDFKAGQHQHDDQSGLRPVPEALEAFENVDAFAHSYSP